MTDENPSPTTRMPVPDGQAPDAPREGAPADAPPPPLDPPPPPVPPVPPFVERPLRRDPDSGRTASVLFGLVVLGLGLWFFAEHTLGYVLPRIRWSEIWPVFLIGIGLWIVLGSMRRGSR